VNWIELVTSLATVGLLAATGVLAWFTRSLVSQTAALVSATDRLGAQEEQTRRETIERRRRELWQAALSEAVANCRSWWTQRPQRLDAGRRVPGVSLPSFLRLAALLETEAITPEVRDYLVWTSDFTPAVAIRYDECVRSHGGDSVQVLDQCRGIWASALDLMQAVACVLRGCATADPVLQPVSMSFSDRWLQPEPAPPQARELEHAQRVATDGAPPFPTAPYLSECSPPARDRAGAEHAEARQQLLHNQFDQS
jgi:hypothetical protein